MRCALLRLREGCATANRPANTPRSALGSFDTDGLGDSIAPSPRTQAMKRRFYHPEKAAVR
jgi:hypothetical protein